MTDAPLPAAAEPVEDGCGSCTRCLPACPTGAFIRPGVLDARRCLAWLVQAPGSFPLAQREALGAQPSADRLECPPQRFVLVAPRVAGDPAGGPRTAPGAGIAPQIALGADHQGGCPGNDAAGIRRSGRVAVGELHPAV